LTTIQTIDDGNNDGQASSPIGMGGQHFQAKPPLHPPNIGSQTHHHQGPQYRDDNGEAQQEFIDKLKRKSGPPMDFGPGHDAGQNSSYLRTLTPLEKNEPSSVEHDSPKKMDNRPIEKSAPNTNKLDVGGLLKRLREESEQVKHEDSEQTETDDKPMSPLKKPALDNVHGPRGDNMMSPRGPPMRMPPPRGNMWPQEPLREHFPPEPFYEDDFPMRPRGMGPRGPPRFIRPPGFRGGFRDFFPKRPHFPPGGQRPYFNARF
jgi:hypothetical protein